MMIELNDDHDLEVHIQELRHLDDYRKKSARLRDEGYQALKSWKDEESFNNIDFDQAKDREVLDYFRLIKVSLCDPKIELEQEKELQKKINNVKRYLTIDNIAKHSRSVLLATQGMQILTMVPGDAFLEPTLLCWYWIIREIFTAESPDWSIGGARAGSRAEDEGHSSAYTTIVCVDSLQSFANSCEYTGKFFGKLGEIKERLDELDELDKLPKDLLAKWQEMEKEQIVLSSQAYLLQYWQHFALSIEGSDPKKIQDPNEIKKYISNISNKLPGAISKAKENFVSARNHVKKFRKNERCKFKNSDEISNKEREYLKRKFIRSKSAHQIAISIFDEAIALFDEAIALFDEAIALTEQIEEGISDLNLKNLKTTFLSAAERVRQQILDSPVNIYLASVIDRELSNASLGINQEWDPKELICAATGYSSIIDRPDEDERLRLAIPQLCKVISRSGQFPIGQPYHKLKDSHCVASNSIMLSYFARLVLNTNYQIKLEIVRCMLCYFEEKKAKEPGWCDMFTPECREPKIDSTTNASEALAKINRMLDEQINNIVLEHFSVKRPEDINVPTLDGLFYPDYGLCQAFKKTENKSISQTLHRMRLHITRLSLPSQEDQDNLYSLILYGPPGTGKTTFIEALALTCNVPLVEVTPSDIIKEGEALAEQRARIVFEALSLLTRVVILFDEFDPVLRRRDPNSKDLNVFSFLTPGMLPKLKELHDSAKKRAVAYVLATNLIGTLDEAAIRPGRFDERLGIFPPDLLSRAGRFISQAISQAKLSGKSFSPDSRSVKEVIENTAGAGMSSLARKGWFIYSEEDIKRSTPLHQVLFASKPHTSIINCIDWPQPEEELNLKGNGSAAQKEYLEWAWVKQWDEKLKDDQTSLPDALNNNNYPTSEDLLKQIEKSYDELPKKIKKMKESDFDAVKETVKMNNGDE